MDLERLRAKLEQYGITLDSQQLGQLNLYAQRLVEVNRQVNLTAITEPEAIEDKHMVDCLLVALQPELRGEVVDVGAGAGFPGLVLQVARPELALTLMEPTGKRCVFMQEVADLLGLRVQVLKERAEEAARKQYRERYDVAVSRAVAALPALCEYCLPLVKPGGTMIAMKGEAAAQEADAAGRAIGLLGGELRELRGYTLPDGSARNLVMIQKVRPTPSQYPRNGAGIARKPI